MRPLRMPFLVGTVALVLFTALRVVLALLVLAVPGAADAAFGPWLLTFAKGLVFDLATLAWLVAPPLLYEALLPARLRRVRWHRALRTGWFTVSVALLVFGTLAEVVFWQEFSTRFNFIAVDYLLYTHEVIGNIRESYPVPLLLAGVAAVAALVSWMLRRPLAAADATSPSGRARAAFALMAVALPAASLALTDADLMQGSGNAHLDELGGNGLFTLAAAMRRNELDYDRFYATLPADEAGRRLLAMGLDPAAFETARAVRAAHAPDEARAALSVQSADLLPARPKHVVLVSVESLSAEFLGAYGSDKDLTPNLDALARDGLRFDRLFATGTRTVRGLEALSLGTPPIPGQSIVRRPRNTHLATVGEILEHQGFTSSFVYGGYGYFDNMNAYFAGNDYQVVDRTDFPKESVGFGNVWGVADEYLYDNALKVMDAQVTAGAQVFMHIMTTSNHRPYTYPDGRIDIPSPGGRDGAVKYTDWAIGKFIRDARARPWFDDTLFVFVADHCAASAGRTKLPVDRYRIPLILYAPKLVKPGVHMQVASQIDIAPSLLAILRADGRERFFGRSLFDARPGEPRAFVSNYQELGYYKRGRLTVLAPRGKVEAFEVDPDTLAMKPAEVDPVMRDEAIAYYQSAARSFKSGGLLAPAYIGRADGTH